MPLNITSPTFPADFKNQNEIKFETKVLVDPSTGAVSPAGWDNHRKTSALVYYLRTSDDYGVSVISEKNKYSERPPGLYVREEVRECLENGMRLSLSRNADTSAYKPYDLKHFRDLQSASSSYSIFSKSPKTEDKTDQPTATHSPKQGGS